MILNSPYDHLLQAFIADNPHEQHNLMRVILSGSHLTHLLTPYFTPHCIPPTELLNLYTSLSKAVRDPVTSLAALTLLSRLDIKKAGDRLVFISLKFLLKIKNEAKLSVLMCSLLLIARWYVHVRISSYTKSIENILSIILPYF